MNLSVFNSNENLSVFAVEQILQTIKSSPRAVLCLATGDSPKLTYQLFVKEVFNQKINLDDINFVALDEWLGVPSSNSGSCHYFLNEKLFSPLKIKKDNIHLFD